MSVSLYPASHPPPEYTSPQVVPRLQERLTPQTPHPTQYPKSRCATSRHKKRLIRLLFLCGPWADCTPTLPSLSVRLRKLPISLIALNVPERLSSLRSMRRPFQPSTSLSSLSPRSFSSRSSRSARLASSWCIESLFCNSSMVARRRSILSRAREISSVSCVFVLSRRSICDCRSLTVRSTLRTERASLVRVSSTPSSCFSSYAGRLVCVIRIL